jgi:hypothetical protein
MGRNSLVSVDPVFDQLSLSVSSHQSFNKSKPVEPRCERLLDALRSRLLRNSFVIIRRFGL